jgi:hypothetical protein
MSCGRRQYLQLLIDPASGEKCIRCRQQSEGYGSLIARHDSRMKKEHRHIGAPLFMQTIEVAA